MECSFSVLTACSDWDRHVAGQMRSLDPDPAVGLEFSDVDSNSVSISWSIGNTAVINRTDVCYTEWNYDQNMTCVSKGMDNRMQNVSNLLPGHTYKFSVVIYSFNRHSTSATVLQTTGYFRLVQLKYIQAETICNSISVGICQPN
jgi:Fibronectin type III domain